MSYKYSHTDKRNLAWMKKDKSVVTLLQVKLVEGRLRGLHPFGLQFDYSISAIAGENGVGKSTVLAIAACGYHNKMSGYLPTGRKLPYYTFSDFFVQSREEIPPDGIHIRYQILYDSWRGGKSGPGWQSRRKRVRGKWNNYDSRVNRNVVYFGVQRVVPHFERSTHKSYRARFSKEILDEEHRRKICKIAGRIMGKTYDGFEKHTHSKYSLPIAKSGKVRYSGFNMGAGESAVFEIFVALFETGRGSLLVIDELELGLHERAQIRFVNELKKLCDELHCQVICSTHSHVILDALPPEGRFFLSTVDDRTVVTKRISADYACGKLRGANIGEMGVLVEDDVAATVLKLGMPHQLRERVKVNSIGSSSAVLRGMATKYLEGIDNCVCVLDGDKRIENAKNVNLFKGYVENRYRKSDCELTKWIGERLAYLPSRKPPERWLIRSCIKRKEKASLANAWGVSDERVIDDWLENALREPPHNEFHAISKDTHLEKAQIIADLVRFLVVAKPGVLDKVTKHMTDRLEQ